MKLRNKKTGEIGNLKPYNNDKRVCVWIDNVSEPEYIYNSLAELNAEWEDAPEEPKEHYFITEYGRVFSLNEYEGLNNVANVDDYKQIGNYFETDEEAEKAVEKLKAWKRLKDKGIKIGKRRHSAYGGEMYWTCPNGTGISDKEIWVDLDLLFGGEK